MKPIPLKNPRRRFSAWRDDNGVAHVEGQYWRDALYGLGYLHALDRPTQMLFSRAVASGQSSERIAESDQLFETDVFFRRVGLYRNLDQEVTRLDDQTFGDLTAYCEGVNDGISQFGRSFPMWMTGFQPEPWNQQSVMLIGNLLNFGGLAVGQQQNERLLLELIQQGIEPAKLRELFEPLLDDVDFELLKQVKISHQLSDEALELITDLPRLAGSNAWAVSPARSATGRALLAADPHLEVNRLPSIWYEAVLRWEGDYVMGATLPGCPMFGIARTRRLAWGVTYLKGDTSDYFIEDVRETEDGRWQYRRGEEWLNFEVRQEVVRKKSGAAESLRVFTNPQGTLTDDPAAKGPGYHLLVAWTGDHEGVGQSVATWLALPGCATALEGMDLVRECPQPTLCWAFADAEGHIGLQANGWFPIRRPGVSGMLPVPAWDVENHWRGWVPAEELPRVYDPPEGFVATANENINPPDRTLISLPVPDYRKRRIVERLRELPQATLDDMQKLQYDVISTQARDLLEIFLPCLPEGPSLPESDVRRRLENWNYSYHPESLEATLFSRFYRNVLLEIFGMDSGIGWRRVLYLSTRVGFSSMVVTCLDRMLHKQDSLWWEGRDKGELIRTAAAKLASEVDQPWSATNAFRFTNRFFESEMVGRTLGFHTGDLPMPGCHATPFQGHLLRAARRETTFAPSYHFTTDLGTDEAWTNLPGGPSESRFSGWYMNDIPRWCSGSYKRLGLE